MTALWVLLGFSSAHKAWQITGGLAFITWGVITQSADKISASVHAQLLTTVECRLTAWRLYRCDEMEQMWPIAALMTFWWLLIFCVTQTDGSAFLSKCDADANRKTSAFSYANKYVRYPNVLASLCTLLLFCQFCLLEAGRQHGWCTESDFEFMVLFHSERSVLLFQPNSQGGPQASVR